MADNNGRKWAIGAVLLGVAGYVAGILTAPKSGKETRKDIKNAAGTAMREVEKQLKALHTEIQELSEKTRDFLKSAGAKAKSEAEMLLKQANDAQAKIKEILSSIHEGTAEDPELQAALKEAKAAKDHLKKYLAKQAKSA